MKPLSPIGNIILGALGIIWIGLILFLMISSDVYFFPYIIMIAGIFATISFFGASFILFSTKQSGPGPWVFFGVVTFLITTNQFNETFVGSEPFRNFSVGFTMLILFVAAVLKLWDTLEFTEVH